jgi:hypothetical protein
MNAIMIGITVAAFVLAVIAAHVFNLGKSTGPLALAFTLVGFLTAWVVGALLRRKRLREWCATEGTIQSCDADSSFKQTQTYRCAYVFWAGDTRQGGTFLIGEPYSDPDDRLDEIRKELMGCSVRVRYDQKDCTRCMVEDKKVMSWDISNY